ncbi:MAG: D-glycero-beta-D-manno-heptose 1,7-bisphosphate 7-phosphatase [Chloroflexi bacterium]|nr:D-glycero-beta-D-manno-heptose 1,7-bisphosphate 7-phosphatase [Chloroflexota bacterium]
MRAIFLDRDGVICENQSDHVKSWSEFKFLPGAKSGLVTLSRLGLPIIVVTNQAAIGRGMVSADVVEAIHQRMVAEITTWGGRIDRVIYCPHRPEDRCDCRKPKPGMLLQAAQELNLDLSRSYLVGDAASDIQAGQQVGCRTYLVLTGRGVEQLVPALHLAEGSSLVVTRNLVEAANYIFKREMIGKGESDRPQLTFLERYRQLLAASF